MQCVNTMCFILGGAVCKAQKGNRHISGNRITDILTIFTTPTWFGEFE